MANVLCVNCGSSSVKAAVIAGSPDDPVIALARRRSLLLDGIGTDHPRLRLDDGPAEPVAARDHAEAVTAVLEAVERAGDPPPDLVGHRLVHGGATFVEPVLLDDDVRTALATLVPLAPLHLPSELAAIDAVARHDGGARQVACFDTAFHATLPEAARRLPLPAWVAERGIRRFGFHGLSYEWTVASLGARNLGRAVIAHLGSGSSAAAVVDGLSVDTTMGFTPTGGLVMGTRTGDLDPGTLVHLLRHEGLTVDDLGRVVDHESGLLGLSERTSDMRDLLARAADGDDRAELAVAVYCRQAAKHLAALSTAAGGLDSLVFTGGIGERSPEVRARIAARLDHLGVVVDPAANARGAGLVSPAAAAVRVWAHPTDEEAVVAHHTLALATP